MEDGYFYIGQTPYLTRRIDEHKRRKAAEWTKIHKYEFLIDKFDAGLCTSKEAEALETEVTIRFMKEHGWKKVRGGNLSALDEKEIQRVMIKYRKKYAIDDDLYNVLVNELDDDMKVMLARYISK
ncbi:GIY-YIG nuclease family protein [Paenibacillus elgii]|uniref:GIY-YIG nuclease family protein n=1 Tax=Paenibacillus elgii TaxID=189691 RepID=UPI0013CFAB41|nr:GIY-YIG nuclease family protein [Paenibacillus elgii]NEN82589.1 GIY-YIG nuclease family protein [Paenibacillus elgii]